MDQNLITAMSFVGWSHDDQCWGVEHYFWSLFISSFIFLTNIICVHKCTSLLYALKALSVSVELCGFCLHFPACVVNRNLHCQMPRLFTAKEVQLLFSSGITWQDVWSAGKSFMWPVLECCACFMHGQVKTIEHLRWEYHKHRQLFAVRNGENVWRVCVCVCVCVCMCVCLCVCNR